MTEIKILAAIWFCSGIVLGLFFGRIIHWGMTDAEPRSNVLPFDPRSQQLQAAVGRRTP